MLGVSETSCARLVLYDLYPRLDVVWYYLIVSTVLPLVQFRSVL
jgi:hypothetical protein